MASLRETILKIGTYSMNAEQLSAKPPIQTRLRSYGISHARTFISSLGRLYQNKIASLMTILVIAIALALPSGFFVLLNNAVALGENFDSPTTISAYLKDKTSNADMQSLAIKLQQDSRFSSVQTIDADEALVEFKAISGYGDIIDSLGSNPLPSVIIITPIINKADSEQLSNLRQELSEYPIVEKAKLDMEWVQRLFAITRIIERSLFIIAGLLGLAVILTIGNTIRLDIQSRSQEIIVQKLIGATNPFIRRPFLYTGLWYGLLGSFVALVLINVSLFLLKEPVSQLAGLYNSPFALHTMSFSQMLLFLLIAIVLGLLGSWLAVGRHLKAIEPK